MPSGFLRGLGDLGQAVGGYQSYERNKASADMTRAEADAMREAAEERKRQYLLQQQAAAAMQGWLGGQPAPGGQPGQASVPAQQQMPGGPGALPGGPPSPMMRQGPPPMVAGRPMPQQQPNPMGPMGPMAVNGMGQRPPMQMPPRGPIPGPQGGGSPMGAPGGQMPPQMPPAASGSPFSGMGGNVQTPQQIYGAIYRPGMNPQVAVEATKMAMAMQKEGMPFDIATLKSIAMLQATQDRTAAQRDIAAGRNTTNITIQGMRGDTARDVAGTRAGATLGAAQTRATAGGSDAGVSPEAFKAQFDVWAETGQKPSFGYGKAGQAAHNAYMNALPQMMKDSGFNAQEIATKQAEFQGKRAASRALGTRESNVFMAADEADRLAPLAVAASEALPRTGVKSLNDLIQKGKAATASPELRRFAVANTGLVTAYSQVMQRGGIPTDSAREHAESILNTAFSKEDYAAGVDQLQQEIAAAKKAPAAIRKQFEQEWGGTAPGASGDGWSIQEVK